MNLLGIVPDPVIRFFIRRRLQKKLAEANRTGSSSLERLISTLKESPIALHTREANSQHYELPPEFFKRVLGPHLKYSCGYWENGTQNLAISEEAMLELYVARGRLYDGQKVLELGCGWGSLSLYLARRFPNSEILSVSNSRTQKALIDAEIAREGLRNLTVETRDMNDFETQARFDRVVSIEMFEHMRNYEVLLNRIASWLKPEGLLFVHIFSHHKYPYLFTRDQKGDWMGRHFFTGGMMPSDDLLNSFNQDLKITERWIVSGRHYAKTSNAWLRQMESEREHLEPMFQKTYGRNARKWWTYWRLFFMACAELFDFRGGSEWHVVHYVLEHVKKCHPEEPSDEGFMHRIDSSLRSE